MEKFGIDENRVWVTVGRTIATEPFESIKIEAGYSQSYGKKDDPQEIIQTMVADLSGMLHKEYRSIKRKVGRERS